MADYNYRNIKGEWQNEPDFVMFTEDESSLTCLVLRHPALGHLCGYVIIPQDLYKEISISEVESLEVHWGVTFNDYLNQVQLEGRKPYAIGFDCAHAGDLVPSSIIEYDEYRNIEFVKAECRKLAKQVKEIMNREGGSGRR